jgi:CO/xanthine dehydrogenase Mo-binding subunit
LRHCRQPRHRPGADRGRDHLWDHRGALWRDHPQRRRVEQTNFDTYQILRVNEAPAIEVHIVQSFEPPGRIGETGTSAIIPAVANAIFAVTGKRLRKLPVDTTALKQPE